MGYKYFQSTFNFDGAVQVGQGRQTIADWLNLLMSAHGISISVVSITVLPHGLFVLVQTQETSVGV